ncbi:hypothetical protein FHS15_001605 [Paenibacillus castaneae]|uniref:hypothetical protein n=1 Tax=Paenibacillus castaneae TaxID=474957 RepID=UPI000C9B0FD8|nr:hypothetical protein [Paenibacillus castaneae]NIK76480.1 hypothetical protein [Paenibacillus castaneae]
MNKQILMYTALAFFSLWGSVYVGSLAPQLWKQSNYRGAVGVVILAGFTLVIPILLRVIREK